MKRKDQSLESSAAHAHQVACMSSIAHRWQQLIIIFQTITVFYTTGGACINFLGVQEQKLHIYFSASKNFTSVHN